MIKHYLIPILFLSFFSCENAQKESEKPQENAIDFTELVNPFIGTSYDDGGRNHPGAAVPWGMVNVIPHNIFRDTTASKPPPTPYVAGNKEIYGFAHTGLSGVGCHEAGSIVFMPVTGELQPNPNGFKSAFSKEIAKPGYYSVHLDKPNVDAEFTATTRTGLSKYTFPKGESHILLDLSYSVSHIKDGKIKLVADDEIEGYKVDGAFCGCYNRRKIYFVAKFSKKAKAKGLVKSQQKLPVDQTEAEGKIGAYYTFDTNEEEEIYVKVGISYVSIENARLNLEKEQPVFDFNETLTQAKATWNKELSRIKVAGGTKDQQINFYTGIYHSLFLPHVFEDVNGEYPSMTEKKVAKLTEGEHRYSVYSLWDTYRTLHPLMSLAYPEKQEDMIRSVIDMYEEGGWLPLWELHSDEIYTMVGDPALSIIVDAYAKGIRGFDAEKALEAMVHNARALPNNKNIIRPCAEEYERLGYMPIECDNKQYVPYLGGERTGVWGSVSNTLEFAYSDWCVAEFARLLGKDDIAKEFQERSQYYRNLYNPKTNFFQARYANGDWLEDFNPLAGLKEGSHRAKTTGVGYCEGSAWQYKFFVPHDIAGVKELSGGDEVFVSALQESFDKDYFDMSNEPDITFPYLFNYVKGEEWRTQETVRKCIDRYFKNTSDGLPGNDDAGTMSAWLVFSMMGIFPDCPGSTTYQLSSPVFDEVEIALHPKFHKGEKFTIKTTGNAENKVLIEDMKLNGNTHEKFTIDHKEITDGGILEVNLKDKSS